MEVTIANLTLRFYEKEGWTAEKVASYLVNSKDYSVTYRPDLKYFAVYGNSGAGVFKKKLKKECTFRCGGTITLDDLDWYIRKEK